MNGNFTFHNPTRLHFGENAMEFLKGELAAFGPTAIAFCIGIYVVRALIIGTAVPGWSSLILSIWLVGGFVLISLGIVGTYLGQIYTEVKHRPLYHVAEILE